MGAGFWCEKTHKETQQFWCARFPCKLACCKRVLVTRLSPFTSTCSRPHATPSRRSRTNTHTHTQESLAAPDALFVPSAFRIIAALAHSPALQTHLQRVAPPTGLQLLPRAEAEQPAAAQSAAAQLAADRVERSAAEHKAGQAGAAGLGLSAEAAARLERVLPAAVGAALQSWVPWKVRGAGVRGMPLRPPTLPSPWNTSSSASPSPRTPPHECCSPKNAY